MKQIKKRLENAETRVKKRRKPGQIRHKNRHANRSTKIKKKDFKTRLKNQAGNQLRIQSKPSAKCKESEQNLTEIRITDIILRQEKIQTYFSSQIIKNTNRITDQKLLWTK